MSDRDRIEYLMNLCMLTPSQFADKTGIQRASISHILSNRNKPSLEVMLKIHNTFPDVDLAWLIAGEGTPPDTLFFKQNNHEVNDIADNVGYNVSSMQMETTLFSDLQENNDSTFVAIDKYSTMQHNIVNVNKNDEKKEDNILEQSTMDNVSSHLLIDKDDKNVAPLINKSQTTDIELKTDIQKRIKEIKIFYDNGTYETFLPENDQ